MTSLWAFHRRGLLATASGVVVIAVFVGLAAASSGSTRPGRGRPSVAAGTTVSATPAATRVTPSTVDPNYHPTYIAAPSPAVTCCSQSQIGQLEAVKPPAPLYPPSMPAVSSTQTENAEDFAYAFVPRLLGINFRTETRFALEEWTEAEAAADVGTGLPQAAADNGLYAALFVPSSVSGGGPSPIPSPSEWTADAKRGTTWQVSHLTAAEDPGWAQAIASGYQSPDQLMAVLDVTGNLRVTGENTTAERFSFQLTLGSALHHPGYGAVMVTGWKAD